MSKLKINPELEKFLPVLDAEEEKQLEASLKEEGLRDPILIWKGDGTVVDGHNRYRLCKKLKITIKTRMREFPDLDAVKKYMIVNQLARRNLTNQDRQYLMGTLYNTEKQSEKRTNQGGERTSAKIAEKFGVGEKTVRRSGEYAEGIDLLAKAAPIKATSNIVKDVADRLKRIQERKKDADLTTTEVAALSKVETPEKAAAVATKMIEKKVVQKAASKPATPKKPVKKDDTPSANVLYCAPNFAIDGDDNVYSRMDAPKMARNSVAFIRVEDWALPGAIALVKSWGLTYAGSLAVRLSEKKSGPGTAPLTYSNPVHEHVVIADRGMGIPLAEKDVRVSVIAGGDDVEKTILGVIGTYFPKETVTKA